MSTTQTITAQNRGAHRMPKQQTTVRRFLPHIEGLRGVSIALVVFFHVFIGKVSSGVDVFLFVGGILLLTSQLKNASNPTGLTFFQSILRIIRRLFPALLTVTSISGLAALAIYPPSEWKRLISDISASVTYWMNWHLGLAGNTYASAGQEVSPYQHLWSMSAQLQIYVAVIAVVFFTRYLVNRRYHNETLWRAIVIVIISLMTVASFVYATVSNLSGDQTLNYYSTFSRFWEIGLGALFGFVVYKTVLTGWLRWTLATAGFVLIFSVGLFLNGSQQFPGPWTLVPVIGAVAVVASGIGTVSEERTLRNFGPVIFLETRPLQFLGRISYSLYLWHWTVLILVVHVTGISAKNPVVGIPVIIGSIILATLTHRFVEVPLRQSEKPERGNVFSIEYVLRARRVSESKAAPVAASLMIGLFLITSVSPQILSAGTAVSDRVKEQRIVSAGGYAKAYPGAGEFLYGMSAPGDVPIMPSPSDSTSTMMPQTQSDGCFSDFDSGDLKMTDNNGNPCAYGDRESNRVMYIVGGSHSEQYLSALDEIGRDRGIKMVPILKMGCALGVTQKFDGSDYKSCYEDWTPKAEQYIIDNPPTDGVFMVSTRPTAIFGGGPEVVPDYYVDAFRRISDAGIKIYGVRDNPWMTNDDQTGAKDVHTCVSENGNDKDKCGQPANKTLSDVNPAIQAYAGMNIVNLDMTKALVKDGWAYPVIGNMLVYRDSHHMTQDFVRTLKPELERQMFG